jgi:hypothetical protein
MPRSEMTMWWVRASHGCSVRNAYFISSSSVFLSSGASSLRSISVAKMGFTHIHCMQKKKKQKTKTELHITFNQSNGASTSVVNVIGIGCAFTLRCDDGTETRDR